MLPTLYIGDYLFVAKGPYGYSRYSFPFTFPSFDGRILSNLPKRGDVAVFRPPGAEIEFVKRVIGLPGDRVHLVNNVLFLNGKRVEEPYKRLMPERHSEYAQNFPQTPDMRIYDRGMEMLRNNVVSGELVVPAGADGPPSMASTTTSAMAFAGATRPVQRPSKLATSPMAQMFAADAAQAVLIATPPRGPRSTWCSAEPPTWRSSRSPRT